MSDLLFIILPTIQM